LSPASPPAASDTPTPSEHACLFRNLCVLDGLLLHVKAVHHNLARTKAKSTPTDVPAMIRTEPKDLIPLPFFSCVCAFRQADGGHHGAMGTRLMTWCSIHNPKRRAPQ
jgi:hypothetical protein